MALNIGAVFLTSVDADLFAAYLLLTSSSVLFPTSNTTIAFYYFFSFLFPTTYVLHFIISYSCQKSLNIFCFQVTLPSVLQRQTLLPPLVSSLSFSQQKRLLNIVVIYSKQIFPPGLSSFSGKVVKVFIETVGGRVMIEGLFLSLLRNHLDQQGDRCRKAQNCRICSL